MFSRDQIRNEVTDIRNGKIAPIDSEVWFEWADMAADWLIDSPGDYLRDGFQGFNQRSIEQIILDFHIADLLSDPLSDEEFNWYMDRK